MKIATSRATKYSQGTRGATKKEVSIRAESIIKKIILEETSPDASILNGPCRIHYAYLDRKRVSNHLMGGCMAFVKLQ
jgi:hypothetical protein